MDDYGLISKSLIIPMIVIEDTKYETCEENDLAGLGLLTGKVTGSPSNIENLNSVS